MNKILWTSLALLVLAAGAVYFLSQVGNDPDNGTVEGETLDQEQANREAVEQLVTTFGKRLQNVSLLSPEESLDKDMKREYGEFLTPELLSEWKEDPTEALGKETSSPWPDRIEIYSTTKNPDGTYTVQGNVIEITSVEAGTDDAAAIYQVEFDLEQRGNLWLISASEKGIYVGEKL